MSIRDNRLLYLIAKGEPHPHVSYVCGRFPEMKPEGSAVGSNVAHPNRVT